MKLESNEGCGGSNNGYKYKCFIRIYWQGNKN